MTSMPDLGVYHTMASMWRRFDADFNLEKILKWRFRFCQSDQLVTELQLQRSTSGALAVTVLVRQQHLAGARQALHELQASLAGRCEFVASVQLESGAET